MKFREILRFELVYQFRRVWTWGLMLAIFAISVLLTRDGTLSEALHDDFYINSPFAVAKTTVVGCLVWLVAAAAFAGEAAARDITTGIHPITYSLPVRKTDFVFGRFLAAVAVNAIIQLAVQLGVVVAVYAPGIDPALIGPFRIGAYLNSFLILAVPTVFVATAIQFSFALYARRAMTAYLGSMLLFFLSYIVALFLLFNGRKDVANIIDVIGVHFIVSELSHLWTTAEKSHRLLTLEGTVLVNRVIWMLIGSSVLAIAYIRFQLEHVTATSWLDRLIVRLKDKRQTTDAAADTRFNEIHVPSVQTSRGSKLFLSQTTAIFRRSLRSLVTSWAGLFLLMVIPLMVIPVVIDQMETNGVPLLPTTIRVIAELTSPLSAELSRWVIIPMIIIFFAGEVIWREREAGLGEIHGALPGSDWAPIVGKLLAIWGMLAVFTFLQMGAAMLGQTILDYYNYEIGLYLKILFGLQLPEYLLFAVIALSIHAIIDHKYVGHLVCVLAFMVITVPFLFGIENKMLIFSSGPGWNYTEMQGFGNSVGPWLWFKLYWTAWALLVATGARLLWVRGSDKTLAVRRRLAVQRFSGTTASLAVTSIVGIFCLGGYIFYNTNIINTYSSKSSIRQWKAGYEKNYGRLRDIHQPDIVQCDLQIELFTKESSADVTGDYQLVNAGSSRIDTIVVTLPRNVTVDGLEFDKPVAVISDDKIYSTKLFRIAQGLLPGGRLRLHFHIRYTPKGFGYDGIDPSISENGTYFAAQNYLPHIGYQSSRELSNASERRDAGLPERPLIPSLYDQKVPRQRNAGTMFSATIGTDEDQVAAAPGALMKTWKKAGRAYFTYKTSAPIGSDWTIFSARYDVHQEKWDNVAIRVFHHPAHTLHVSRVIESAKASLEHYSKTFGPYLYTHLNVVEHPGRGVGMHADPSMIVHQEGFTQWTPDGTLDLPYAIVCHEMAHQWTVPYAAVEGAPVMSESVAWYYGMKAVAQSKGSDQLERLRQFMRQPYPYAPIRRGEPLLRGLDPYLSYRKGPFALYALSEYVGEEPINNALRSLLEKHRPDTATLATTLDLYAELKRVTPDSLHYLLYDFFEVNTYWKFRIKRVNARQENGRWIATLVVDASKTVDDDMGNETAMEMNDLVEIGLYGPNNSQPLYLRQHPIRSGEQIITIDLDEKPVRAGIDPRFLLIDLEPDDNFATIE